MSRARAFKQSIIILVLFAGSMVSLLAQKQIGASEPLTKKARDHLNLFQYDEALQLLRQAIEVEPDNWEPWFLAGRALMKTKKEAESEKYLVKANQLNPGDLEVQKALGALYIAFAKASQAKGQGSEMTGFLHKACLAYPAGTKIWLSLLEQWWKAGEYDKIKKEGDLIVKANSLALEQGDDTNLQSSLVIVARTWYRDGDFSATDNFLKHARKIKHHNEEMYTIEREIKNKAEENARKLVDQAMEFSKQGNYDKALELLQAASKVPGARSGEILEMIDKLEKDASLKKTLKSIDTLIESKTFEEALEKLEEASLNFPENPEVLSRLASVSATVEKIKDAEAKANFAIISEKRKKQELSRQLSSLLDEGQSYEQKKNYDMAIMSLEKALKLAPDHKELPQDIARLKVLAERARERQNAFSVKFNEFESLFSSDSFSQCYEAGKELLNDFPEHSVTISAIFAEACLRAGKLDEAKEAILKLENAAEHATLYHYILGMVAYENGDREVALDHLKMVKEKNGSFRPGINTTIALIYLYKIQIGIYILLIGLAFPALKAGKEALANWRSASMIRRVEKIRENGNYEANLAFLEERYAKEDIPNAKQVQVMLAEALLRTGKPQRAYELANNLLKKDARNPLAKRIAGEAALLLEDTSTQGLDHIQGLLKIDETRKDVITFLGKVYIKQQADHKMAQDFILKAISINPSDTESVAYLADVFIKRQTYNQQSLKIFERAIKAAPEVPEYYMAMIENLHRIDNHPEAEKWRETAAARFPAQEEFSANRQETSATRSSLKVKSENNQQDASKQSSSGAFPDYDSIGDDSDEALLPPLKSAASQTTSAPAKPNPAVVSGPQKSCPHCNATIPLKEYYCTSCGKPC